MSWHPMLTNHFVVLRPHIENRSRGSPRVSNTCFSLPPSLPGVSEQLKDYSYFIVIWNFVVTETRKQVKEATERLGGQYSPHLHPQCTHLVVQISFLIHGII